MKQMKLQKKLFDTFKNRYQNNLVSTDFVLYYVQLLYYKCH